MLHDAAQSQKAARHPAPRRRRRRWTPATRRQALHRASIEAAPARVLLAEDDDDMRGLVASALREEGFEVTGVRSGNELLECVGSMVLSTDGDVPLDLIVSDVRMPGKTGLEVLAGLRRSDWSTPVILITAFGDERTHSEAMRLGAVAALDKPFDIHELRALARAAACLGRPTGHR